MLPIGDSPKRVDRLSPSNGRTDGMKEPMGGTVLTYDHDAPTKRLGDVAPVGDRSA